MLHLIFQRVISAVEFGPEDGKGLSNGSEVEWQV